MHKIIALATLASLVVAVGARLNAPVLADSSQASVVAHRRATAHAANDADASCKVGCWAQNASGSPRVAVAAAVRTIDMESAGILG